MSGHADGGFREPDPHLSREAMLTARAKRRLIEHELTRRRTLLVVTVGSYVLGVILALKGETHAGGALVAAAVASGAAALPRRSDRDA
jgi:hypothetical protein